MKMNIPLSAPVCRELLRVSPQHEDEGYLSPSEEDLKKSYLSIRRQSCYLDCKSPNDLGSSGIRRTKSAGEEVENWSNDIPWDKIACLPQDPEEHLSWDKLKLPVPYRFYDDHLLCMRQIRKPPQVSYITDSIEKQRDIVDNIWRLYGPEDLSSFSAENETQKLPALSFVKSSTAELTYISAKQLVKDIFHLICGRESLSFAHYPGEHFTFIKNPGVLVEGISPGLLENLCTPFLKCGKIFKRLGHISALHFDEKLMEREGFQSNAVFTAFLKYISDYLQLFQTIVMIKAAKIHSIGALNMFHKPFLQQLQTLEWILNFYVSTDQITLLKGLNSMMLSCETPFIADLIRSAFLTCSAAYLRYVSEWIFRGQLTKGFHVQRTKSSTYQDRRYWVKQFSQLPSDCIPTFLENAVNTIFETGKAINLLSIIKNSEHRSALLSCVLHDDTSVIRPAVEFESVTSLESEWKIKVDSFFEEYSFLQGDIEAVWGNTKENKRHVIDFDAVEEAKQSFEARRFEVRRNIVDRKAEQQKILRDTLNEQLLEKHNREQKEKENQILEDEKISAYIKARDQRDLQEEIRLMKKHFGERISETVGLKNIKKRIAASGSDFSSVLNSEDVPVEDLTVSKNIQDNISSDEHDGDSHTIPLDCSTEFGSNLPDEWNSQDDDPMMSSSILLRRASGASGRKKSVNFVVPPENLVSVPLDNIEDKFNPDKIIVREPIPYDVDLDLDSIVTTGVLSQSLMSFDQTFPTKTESETKEDSDFNSRHDSFCLNFFLNQSVLIPVAAQSRMINATLLHYFLVEKRLLQHVEALNSYLCLQNGLFGHFLTTSLIQEVKNGALSSKTDLPRKIGRLNQLLGEAVALSTEGAERNDIRDHLGFILVRESSRNSMDFEAPKPTRSKILTSVYEVLNEVTINYSVEWPLSILLTDNLLINYEKLFTFQVRLYRAELLLLGLNSLLKYKGKARQLSILHHFCYRMLHFVRSVRHYINVTVIHCAWTDLVSSFPKMNSFDKLYDGLVRYIKFISTNCLLGAKSEGVKTLLLDQLTVIECFCKDVEVHSESINWATGEEINPRRFAKLEQKFKVWEEIQKVFIQVFFKLANKGTYQKVSYFLQLFNFNGYFENNFVE